ncbi:specifically androgen-regulated gene protein [Oryctolagus cuniculus]|uniref:specifically androgen-regulated gene protein n=1 Tax=Oryctolagus cuniculus TaxID=9986 RepID=UPI00387A35C4
MPERELWPAGPGWEPVTRVGSCDSMSDSSYDFLSAEEKACLLFLEETIGSLDTEGDSGLSTDESELVPTPRGFRAPPKTQPAPKGNPKEAIAEQRPEPRTVTQASSFHPPEPQGLGLRSGSYSLPRNIHIGRNQNLGESTSQTNSHAPGEPAGLPAVKQPGSRLHGEPRPGPAGPREAAPDLDVAPIPPPEAFRDAQPEQREEDHLPKRPGEQSQAPHARKTEETSSEAMSHKANERGSVGHPQPLASASDPGAQPASLAAPKPRKLPPNIVLKSSRSSFHSQPQNWLSRHTEAASGESGLGPSSLQEQRKARREALEKLGLPQDQEAPGLHLSKPTSSFRLREPRAQGPAPGAAPGPAQPAAPVQVSAAAGKAPAPAPVPALSRGPVPAKAPAPAPAQGSSPSKAWTPAQETPPGKVAAAKSMPIPIPKASRANSPLTQPKPDSGLTLQDSSIPGLRQMNFKSNTLERSGVGLSSYLSAEKDPSPQTSTSLGKGSLMDKISPSVLRNSRPRPASLGTGRDFAGIQVGKLADLEQEQSARHLSYQGQSRDKLPRPPCVSVKISPKGLQDEHRREALKKLGLLKE